MAKRIVNISFEQSEEDIKNKEITVNVDYTEIAEGIKDLAKMYNVPHELITGQSFDLNQTIQR
jgi:flagellar capping protein FliD